MRWHSGPGSRTSTRGTVLATLAALSLLGCRDFVPAVREIQPGVLMIETAPGVEVEVLDWGGGGPGLLFLAGGGHTAHEFDEFAPQLTDGFHVVGITRRGGGASSGSRPEEERDAVEDIGRVLDALDLDSAVLIGHSQGGLEAAQFAQAYPGRCRAIVHLDSAYLGGEEALAEILRTTSPPATPARTQADLESAAALRAWVERTQGFLLPESEIRAVNRLDEAGRILGPAPQNTKPKSSRRGRLPELRWESVTCPALGLFAVVAPLEEWLPHYAERYESLGAESRAKAQAYVDAYSEWSAQRREEFARLPQNTVIEFPATGHYFFLKQPEQRKTVEAIREFLAGLE